MGRDGKNNKQSIKWKKDLRREKKRKSDGENDGIKNESKKGGRGKIKKLKTK